MEKLKTSNTKQEILNAALQIFIKKGYKGTTTLDIATEAGVAEVTLFRHFKTKENIFMNAIEPILLDSFKDSIMHAKRLKKYDKIKYILKERIMFISNNKDVINLILIENQINDKVAEFNFIDKTMSIINYLADELNVNKKDKEFYSRLLLGSILSFLYMPKLNEEEVDKYIDKLIEKIMEDKNEKHI